MSDTAVPRLTAVFHAVSDVASAATFYAAALGVPFTESDGDMRCADLGGCAFNLVSYSDAGMDGSEHFKHQLEFQVADVDSAIASILASGGSGQLSGPPIPGATKVAVARDPDDVPIVLFER